MAKKKFPFSVYLSTWVLVMGLAPAPWAAESQPDIQSIIQERVNNGYSVGIVVGVIEGVEQKRTYYTYGRMAVQQPKPVTEETIYEIGSISKTFTALALAQMAEKGKLKLSDPVQRLLPNAVKLPVREGQHITLQHLASHVSGLSRMPDNFKPADPGNPYADYTVEQMYQFLNQYQLPRTIGSKYDYSNLGAGLLGHALSLKAGMSYEDLIRLVICQPLGMMDTGVTLNRTQLGRFAQGHHENAEVPHWDIPTLAGAGALRSTARDMLTYLAAQMGLTSSTLSTAIQRTHKPLADVAGYLKIGLGWHILKNPEQEIIWHNGGTGGFRTFVGFDPKQKKGVIVLSNSDVSQDDLGLYVLNPKSPLTPVRRAITLKAAQIQPFVGKYQLHPNVFFTVTRAGEQLVAEITGQGSTHIYAESESKFFFKEVDAQVEFKHDQQGKITHLIIFQGGRTIEAKRVD